MTGDIPNPCICGLCTGVVMGDTALPVLGLTGDNALSDPMSYWPDVCGGRGDRWSTVIFGGYADLGLLVADKFHGSRDLCGLDPMGLPNPPVEFAILMVALAVRLKASRQASAGGHFSMRSVNTDVAARMVKSTSSRDYESSPGQ
jgi:hypothetical protein